jgi:MFS transporter, CP family, cyanate transporter
MPTSPPDGGAAAAAPDRAGRLTASRWRVLAALLVAAVNLRIAIAVVGPLIEDIQDDLGMSSTLVSVLTVIPFACMGAFSFLGPLVIERYGTRLVLGGALALIGGGTLLRAIMPDALLLIAMTLPIGLGIALAGVVIPIVIKQYFPDHPGTTTGAYTTSLSIGIMLIGFTAVPLADALGSWRDAFALSALPALVALPMWLLVRVDDHRIPVDAGVPLHTPAARLRPNRTGVFLGFLFGLQSICFAALITWGAAVYEDAGWSQEDAALVVSSLGFLTIAASLTIPRLSDRSGRRGWLVAMSLLMTSGIVGMAIDPGWNGFLWMTMFGFGSGALLPLCFALPLDLERSPAQVGQLTGWMLGLGHGMAALGPLLVGPLRDATGGFTLALSLLVVLGLAETALATRVPRRGRGGRGGQLGLAGTAARNR